MGVTIHYSGRIKKSETIKKFIVEVADICGSMGWECFQSNEHFSDVHFPLENLPNGEHLVQSISFQPPETETVGFIFSPSGRLIHPLQLYFFENGENIEEEDDYGSFVKTQFADPKTHVALIKLFRYLSKKYFDEFEVHDEGGFWETEDIKELYHRLNVNQRLIDVVGDILGNLPEQIEADNEDDLLKKIEQYLRDNLDNLGNVIFKEEDDE